jgi:hypothetical protein
MHDTSQGVVSISKHLLSIKQLSMNTTLMGLAQHHHTEMYFDNGVMLLIAASLIYRLWVNRGKINY